MFALLGCEKVAQSELSPKASQASQQLVAPASFSAKELTPAQLAWSRFVDKVERGEQVDPTGQYVSKETVLPVGGERTARPKHDAAKGAIPGLILRASGTVVLPGTANKEDQPTDPIVVCDGSVSCSGGPPPITTTFVSSEGIAPYGGADNANGYVYDLKIGYGSSAGAHYGIPNSYTVLYSDLNKGATGDYIYIGFTRVPSDVSVSPEVYYNEQFNSGPVTLVGVSKKQHLYEDYPFFASYANPTWVDTGVQLGFSEHDLNEGAGGAYIRGRQSKYPGWGSPIEIGVLSSNSSTTQPPAGWRKSSSDLNEGAGGAYIYFCVKNR